MDANVGQEIRALINFFFRRRARFRLDLCISARGRAGRNGSGETGSGSVRGA